MRPWYNHFLHIETPGLNLGGDADIHTVAAGHDRCVLHLVLVLASHSLIENGLLRRTLVGKMYSICVEPGDGAYA